jgi:hypothetical protein
MSARSPAEFPAALRTARRQFDRWRRQHRPRARLPEELWQRAATLARRHGLNRTASALGLKYYSLKKRMAEPVGEVSEHEETSCEFVEFLPAPMAAGSYQCTIELDDGRGATVRIHVKGVRMAELASFASAWRSRPA